MTKPHSNIVVRWTFLVATLFCVHRLALPYRGDDVR